VGLAPPMLTVVFRRFRRLAQICIRLPATDNRLFHRRRRRLAPYGYQRGGCLARGRRSDRDTWAKNRTSPVGDDRTSAACPPFFVHRGLVGLRTLVSRRDNVELWWVVPARLSGAMPGDCSDSILGAVNK